jgi:hypothetical protein
MNVRCLSTPRWPGDHDIAVDHRSFPGPAVFGKRGIMKDPMANSHIHWRAVDAPGVVDHEVALAVANDVENATNLPLQVSDFVAASMEVDDPYGFFGIGRDN